VTEAQDRSLVGSRCHTQINAYEAALRGRLIERIFHARIRQFEPLLHDVSPKHYLQSNRTAPVPDAPELAVDEKSLGR